MYVYIYIYTNVFHSPAHISCTICLRSTGTDFVIFPVSQNIQSLSQRNVYISLSLFLTFPFYIFKYTSNGSQHYYVHTVPAWSCSNCHNNFR